MIADIKQRICLLIQKSGIIPSSKRKIIDAVLIECPPDEKLGDLAFPCFALAKELKKSPAEIAARIASEIKKLPPEITEVRAVGSYVNFFLNPAALAPRIFKKTLTPHKKTKEKYIIEYVSPNTNKPLHLGHTRNAVFGESVARMHEFLGASVVRASLFNDRGIHICKSMAAYQFQISNFKIKNKKNPTPLSENKKGDHLVGDYYVLYDKLLKERPEIEEQAKECLQKWESGDKKTRALWKTMNQWALKGINQTYRRLGIVFDKTYYESDIYTNGREIVLDGLKKGLFKKDGTGAVIAVLSQFNLPEKVLLRKDGSTLYITQDIFLAMKKWSDYKPTASIYVIGSEQELYLKQLFAILTLLRVPYAKNCVHLSYGMVRLPEGKMKSREGTVVDADELIDELVMLAKTEILKRENGLSTTVVQKRSETIALAALKYYILLVGPHSDMIFNPKKSIALQGKTGPYLLYTYARLKSIIRKTKNFKFQISNFKTSPYDYASEKQLIMSLLYFEETIEKTASSFNPSLLANYLWDIAKKTNDYYHSTPVLKGAEHARTARLLLINVVADTLKTGLSLLGIQTIEKM